MRCAPIWLILVAVASPARSSEPGDWLLEITLRGRRIEGKPVAWSPAEVVLLGRDGRLWAFPPEEVVDFRKVSDRFQPYSPSEFRAELLRELGEGYDVSGTGHYLVAHPAGQRDQWAGRFEELYRAFVRHFAVRGFAPREPPCPLIGMVCRNQRDFLRYAAGQGIPAGPGVLGYYANASNRIVLFDAGGGASRNTDWRQNASVVLHEATHQVAFNTGIHSRIAPPPVWVAEGLAMLFEAPGVWNSNEATRPNSRINPVRLADFRNLVAFRHRPELLADLVAQDRWFQTSPQAAYAEAWAFTFFLNETLPRQYAEYLARTVRWPPLAPYTAAQRTADFTIVFGDDWRMLEARFLRFMNEVDR
jgi:hypothetical protein